MGSTPPNRSGGRSGEGGMSSQQGAHRCRHHPESDDVASGVALAPAGSWTSSSPRPPPAPPVPSRSVSTRWFWVQSNTITTLYRLNVRCTMAVRCGVIYCGRRSPPSPVGVGRHRLPDGGQGRSRSTPPTHPRRESPIVSSAGSCDDPRPRPTPPRTAWWPDWRHHALLTDLDDDAVLASAEQFHRHHAVVELPSANSRGRRGGTTSRRQLPRQLGLAAMRRARPQPDPLDRRHGEVRLNDELTVARTMRTRLITMPDDSSTAAGDQPAVPRTMAMGETR